MQESILEQVEHIREKMIQSALKHGFSDAHTIQLSEKLDHLLNAYQKKTFELHKQLNTAQKN